MDILISSNLERLIYKIAGEDAEKNAELMGALARTGKYQITEEMRGKLSDFYGGFATTEQTARTIKELYEKTGYIIDTHTAVATSVYNAYREETKDQTVTVIASTASPYKFTRSVMTAIDPRYEPMGDFELVDELSRLSETKVPGAIEEIRSAEVIHKRVCDRDQMQATVEEILGM